MLEPAGEPPFDRGELEIAEDGDELVKNLATALGPHEGDRGLDSRPISLVHEVAEPDPAVLVGLPVLLDVHPDARGGAALPAVFVSGGNMTRHPQLLLPASVPPR